MGGGVYPNRHPGRALGSALQQGAAKAAEELRQEEEEGVEEGVAEAAAPLLMEEGLPPGEEDGWRGAESPGLNPPDLQLWGGTPSISCSADG